MADTNKDTRHLSPLKQAYLAMEEMQARLDALENAAGEPIAVIGIGCRFPGGANGPDEYWHLLSEGVDAVSEVPPGRWDQDRFYDPDPNAPGKTSARHGGFIDDIDKFDPDLFGIAPREAASMDPQQRLLLEVSWEALENAAQAADKLEGSRTGVFFGVCSNDYSFLQVKPDDPSRLDAYYASGIAHSMASGRVSYVLGLEGPSMSVDTACSSSLVAVHVACQSLRADECRMALAGGVNAILSHENTLAFSRLKILGPGGRCRTFDAAADGIVRGEGCGVVVLKRQSHALEDGDRIVALIRGSAVNQDGASSGITAPNGPSQETVIRRALDRARMKPAQIGYVEAHGTGTILGDPIEVQALARVLGKDRARDLWIGSVKTNMGHLEGAAGIAGLIKALLVVQHGEIPPHLHLTQPNPHIPWDEIPVRVPLERTPWPNDGERVAGVSSFGFSGTNAHVIVSEAPASKMSGACIRPYHVLCLSARSEPALARLARRYLETIESRPDEFRDICQTSSVGRAHLSHRLAITAPDAPAMRESLDAFLKHEPDGRAAAGRLSEVGPRRPAFLFTGQGAQYPGMGRELYRTEPVFRGAIDLSDEILRPHLGRSLVELLSSSDGQGVLDDTAFTQPALFAIEHALATLWGSWGVRPRALLGHSVGEYVAACSAGVFSLEDGLKLIAARGRLMQQLPRGGAMAVVFAPIGFVEPLVSADASRLAIAASNGPENTVISGAAAAVDELAAHLHREGVASQRLNVSHAFHSPLMEPILEAFEQVAREIHYRPARIRIVSNLTGTWAEPSEIATPEYWVRHVRQPVRFSAAFETLLADGIDAFIEVGPHPTLLGMARQISSGGLEPVWIPSLRRGSPDWEQLGQSVSAAYVAGVAIDWAGFYRSCGHGKVSLPTYPFDRKRYWIPDAPARRAASALRNNEGRGLLGGRLPSPNRTVAVYESTWRTDSPAFLADHRVHDSVVAPGTAYLELFLAAAARSFVSGPRRLEAVILSDALVLTDEREAVVQVIVTPSENGARAEVLSVDAERSASEDAPWRRHASATLVGDAGAAPNLEAGDRPDQIRSRCGDGVIMASEHYEALRRRGMNFGERFRSVAEIFLGDGEALGRVCLAGEPEAGYQIDPTFLDSAIQVVSAAVGNCPGVDADAVYLPISADRVTLYGSWPGQVWSHARLRASETVADSSFSCDVRVFDDAGHLLTEIDELLFKRIDPNQLSADVRPEWARWLYEVAWMDLDPAAAARGDVVDGVRPDEVMEGLNASLEQARAEVGMDAYDRLWERLERVSTSYVLDALRPWSESLSPGRVVTLDELANELGVVRGHRRLLARFVAILIEDGVLVSADDGQWVVATAPRMDDPAPAIDTLLREHPENAAQIALIRRCGPELGEALRGRREPLDLLFPGGSVEEAEALYRDSTFAQLYRRLARHCVEAIVREARGDRSLRVLEIGGGTGGTTGAILQAFPKDTRYVFTDVSPAFLVRAREKFAAYPFVDYRTLDIERNPDDQGFTGERFDIVVAASMIHATRSLPESLEHVRRLLVPGGLFMLLEGTRPERWIDVTFGMTEGWWRFDDVVRTSYPLLSRAEWLSLLDGSGFEQTASVPYEDRGDVLLLTRRSAEADHDTACSGRGTGRSWIVVGKASETRDLIAGRLQARGRESVVVDLGQSSDGDASARDRFASNGAAPEGVIYVGASDLHADSAAHENAVGLLDLVQSLQGSDTGRPPRLVIVTSGARGASFDPEPVDVAQSPLWGLGQVVSEEHPEMECVRVDLNLTPAAEDLDLLLDALDRTEGEDQIAIRNGRLRVPRLVHTAGSAFGATTEPADGTESECAELVVGIPGDIDSIRLESRQRRAPGRDEIEIRVEAAGLGFRDVLNAVGMRSDAASLGSECAGRVVAVGEEVDRFQVGDRVVALAEGSFRTYANTRAMWAVPLAADANPAEAASLPSAYLTAAYALERVGGLDRGKKVLIHTAAGGVGLAAVALARRAGADIYATAGTPEKRAYLESLGLRNVYDSRTLEFADRIREAAPDGVDIVLNTLAGEFVDQGLSIVAAGGRFLEIGKSDVRSLESVAQQHPDVDYVVVDMVEVCQAQPALVCGLLEDLSAAVDSGELAALPYRTFAAANAAEAFRFMARARHIGKVVLTWPAAGGDRKPAVRIRQDRTYLITGGFGGLGLESARWLADRGALHLMLLGRRPPGPDAAPIVDALERQGVNITQTLGDVSDRERMRALIDGIGSKFPLAGVIHAAGVLDDGVLMQQSVEKFERVFAPKVRGTWNLHELTSGLSLDFFVLFSSTASLLGSPGQGNHAAANAFLDALAIERRRQGLPAISINWGPWSAVGAAAAVGEKVERRFMEHGLGKITPKQGVAILERLVLGEDMPPQVGVVPVEWSRYVNKSEGRRPSRFLSKVLAAEAPSTKETKTSAKPSRESLPDKVGRVVADQRLELIASHVQMRASGVLGLDPADPFDRRRPLGDVGLDSLMAVELRNLLGADLGRKQALPATLIFKYPTVDALAAYLMSEIQGDEPKVDLDEAAPTDVDEIDSLSDDQVRRMLADELSTLVEYTGDQD